MKHRFIAYPLTVAISRCSNIFAFDALRVSNRHRSSSLDHFCRLYESLSRFYRVSVVGDFGFPYTFKINGLREFRVSLVCSVRRVFFTQGRCNESRVNSIC